jgi:short-chain fatty acids transporter
MNPKNNKSFIPSPLILAIGLSFVVYFLALFFTTPQETQRAYPLQLLLFYQQGFWDLLAFAMQMMLVLVLGNVLALTPLFQRLINTILSGIKSGASAVFLTAVFSLLLSYFNWGLGLIFSALLARAIAENARRSGMKINYPLLVAAAYSGLMVWHGGLSGSAPLKVAGSQHFLVSEIGVIPVSETIFSTMNLSLFALSMIIIPLSFLVMAKYKAKATEKNDLPKSVILSSANEKRQFLGLAFGLVLAFAVVYQFYELGLAALNINLINMILLSLGLILYANVQQFMKAVNSAIVSSSGIMIQFPIYAGIMGLMKYSGLVTVFTESLIQISTPDTLAIYSFFSAAVVNFFVPSGGGQWAVQGPILIHAAQELGVSIPKVIMSLAYGDQLTNMIQPFWAIPLLSITGVKAKSILPYTFIIMLVGGALSLAILYWF